MTGPAQRATTTTTRDELVACLLDRGHDHDWRATTPEPGSDAIATRIRLGRREALGVTRQPAGWRVSVWSSHGSPRGEASVGLGDDLLADEAGMEAAADWALRWLP